MSEAMALPDHGLRVEALGPLHINGQPAGLTPARSQLIVALALAGRTGLANSRLCRLLGPDCDHPRPSDSLRQLIARTRSGLGRADDGREWIVHLGHGRYALHPAARVDWADFEAAITAAVAAENGGRLAEALARVRGQPFADCYYWWLDPALVESVTVRIVTAAQALAQISLVSDPAAAARAARIGLAADPAAEQLWRLLMHAENMAGNLAGVHEAWSRCVSVISGSAADGQPEPATAAVYAGLVGRPLSNFSPGIASFLPGAWPRDR
jgi:DNA-binding SARP family transcriptional activator